MKQLLQRPVGGIPMGGYTAMVERMFGDTEILLNTEYREFVAENEELLPTALSTVAPSMLFTLDYQLGRAGVSFFALRVGAY